MSENFKTGTQRVKETTNINKFGEEAADSDFVVAKMTSDIDDDGSNEKLSYQIAVYNGLLVDPFGSHQNREQLIKREVKYRTVSEHVFTYYSNYLRGRNIANYNTANRGFLNG